MLMKRVFLAAAIASATIAGAAAEPAPLWAFKFKNIGEFGHVQLYVNGAFVVACYGGCYQDLKHYLIAGTNNIEIQMDLSGGYPISYQYTLYKNNIPVLDMVCGTKTKGCMEGVASQNGIYYDAKFAIDMPAK